MDRSGVISKKDLEQFEQNLAVAAIVQGDDAANEKVEGFQDAAEIQARLKANKKKILMGLTEKLHDCGIPQINQFLDENAIEKDAETVETLWSTVIDGAKDNWNLMQEQGVRNEAIALAAESKMDSLISERTPSLDVEKADTDTDLYHHLNVAIEMCRQNNKTYNLPFETYNREKMLNYLDFLKDCFSTFKEIIEMFLSHPTTLSNRETRNEFAIESIKNDTSTLLIDLVALYSPSTTDIDVSKEYEHIFFILSDYFTMKEDEKMAEFKKAIHAFAECIGYVKKKVMGLVRPIIAKKTPDPNKESKEQIAKFRIQRLGFKLGFGKETTPLTRKPTPKGLIRNGTSTGGRKQKRKTQKRRGRKSRKYRCARF